MNPGDLHELLKVQQHLIDYCPNVADVVIVDTPTNPNVANVRLPCPKCLFIFLADDIKQFNSHVLMRRVPIGDVLLTSWLLMPDSRFSISYNCVALEALIGRVNKFRL